MPTKDDRKVEVEVATFYTNSVQVAFGSYDFQLLLSLNGYLGLVPQASIAMSPHHAKVLSEILAVKVREWEEAFGVLPTKTEIEARTAQLVERPGAVSHVREQSSSQPRAPRKR